MRMPLRRFTDSMVSRLVLIALLVVVAGSFVRYSLLTTWLREDLEAHVLAERLAIASAVANDIENRVTQRRDLLQRMARALPPERLQQPERLSAWLQEHEALTALFPLGLQVVDEAACDSPAAVSRPLLDTASTQPVIRFAAPIHAGCGALHGVLRGTVPVAAFDLRNVAGPADAGGHGSLLLVSATDQRVLSSTDPSMILRPLPAWVDAADELSAKVPVPSADWWVVASIPKSQAFAAIAQMKAYVVRGSLINLVLVVVLVAGSIGWALKPLFDSARHADAMTRGDAPLQPLPVVRQDEVGHLTAAFNRLLSKLAGSQAELAHMAHHDNLTGLPNRRLLADRLAQALARAKRNETRIVLMVMDLDGFKRINDEHGHEAGDVALRATARRLAAAVRQSDTLARLGGDEFVLLAPDFPGTRQEVETGARTLASKCLATAAQPLDVDGVSVCLGVSIGIAICESDCTADHALKAADRAMYDAKQSGKGRYVFSSRAVASAAAH